MSPFLVHLGVPDGQPWKRLHTGHHSPLSRQVSLFGVPGSQGLEQMRLSAHTGPHSRSCENSVTVFHLMQPQVARLQEWEQPCMWPEREPGLHGQCPVNVSWLSRAETWVSPRWWGGHLRINSLLTPG